MVRGKTLASTDRYQNMLSNNIQNMALQIIYTKWTKWPWEASKDEEDGRHGGEGFDKI